MTSVQLIQGEVELVAVFRGPAAGAVEIAGGGGVHQNGPGHVAAVLGAQLGAGGAGQHHGINRHLHKDLAQLLGIVLGEYVQRQLAHAVVGVGKIVLYASNMGRKRTGAVQSLDHVEHLGNVVLGVFADVIVGLHRCGLLDFFSCCHGIFLQFQNLSMAIFYSRKWRNLTGKKSAPHKICAMREKCLSLSG
jgi:hypothetical protein